MEFPLPGFIRAWKRVMTGQLLKRIDIPLKTAKSTVSIRLKRSSSETCVVLAVATFGSSAYYAMGADEFERFAPAIHDVSNDLRASAQS